MVQQMSKETRSRIIELALKKSTVAQIAPRIGVSLDRVRNILRRAEEKGEIPPGTYALCSGSKPAPAPPADPDGGRIKFKPLTRVESAKQRSCRFCPSTVDVLLTLDGEEYKLCRSHIAKLASGLELAAREALSFRDRFDRLAKVN